ncbi:hypothetical protein CTA1_6245 [Colletotrichum tanaceti]|uniref:Uncharacterized protein n=1 Tax=Colletotrichum tanaceti TaxID=1306861 RepID=A0A4U6XJL2_9PEZI|nr:hypothetical protein CTA1_6245 [Colletotrichum tanaceti]
MAAGGDSSGCSIHRLRSPGPESNLGHETLLTAGVEMILAIILPSALSATGPPTGWNATEYVVISHSNPNCVAESSLG